MPYAEGPTWSPAGDVITFQGRETDEGNSSLYLLRLADASREELLPRTFQRGESLSAWAPDGRRIVYQDSALNISILDVQTKRTEKLAKGWFPTWAPNGRYIAFQLEGGDDPGYAVYDLETKNKKTVLPGQDVHRSLIWSPDSQSVVYSKGGHGDFHGDVYVMEVETQVETKLFSYDGSIYVTDWKKRSVAPNSGPK